MKYLLDTCFISEMVRPHPERKVVEWLESVPSETLFISVVTIGEIRKGLTRLPGSKKKQKLTAWLNRLIAEYADRIVPFDLESAENWGALQGKAELAGAPMSSIDSIIAAQAHTGNFTLVTRNERDFLPSHVPVINPWKDGIEK